MKSRSAGLKSDGIAEGASTTMMESLCKYVSNLDGLLSRQA